jgi:hypothetical protein
MATQSEWRIHGLLSLLIRARRGSSSAASSYAATTAGTSGRAEPEGDERVRAEALALPSHQTSKTEPPTVEDAWQACYMKEASKLIDFKHLRVHVLDDESSNTSLQNI